MSKQDNKVLIYFEDETHLVRRLGAAVISCWSELPARARERLIARAAVVVDEEECEAIGDQIQRFINEHVSASLRARPAEPIPAAALANGHPA